MFKGHVNCRLQITGTRLLKLQQFTIRPTQYDLVSQIDVETSGERTLIINVHFDGVSNEADAVSLGLIVADDIAHKVSFKSLAQISKPEVAGTCFQRILMEGEAPGTRQYTLQGSANTNWKMSGNLVGVLNLAGGELHNLKTLLETKPVWKQSQTDWHQRFRRIMDHTDPVIRFIYLYSILLEVIGDSQDKVDEFILMHEQALTSPKPPLPNQRQRGKNSNPDETIYTRLRNEIGHVRTGSDPQTTREEIDQQWANLAEHVQRAIETKA